MRKRRRFHFGGSLCVLLLAAALTERVEAFIINPAVTPWISTASGRRSGNGQAATLTWSIIPDGTQVSDGSGNLGGSDLVAFLNEHFSGDPSVLDHTKQPWFSILQDSVDRWAAVSGVSFVFEPNDDGGTHNNKTGVLGVRGDIRLGGASIDGAGNTLAFNFLPEFGGDMVLDTDEIGFARSNNNHLFLRNTVMHELGHAFGLSHVRSRTDRLLMEPFTDEQIDGPQLDEIRGAQYFFGDVFEATNEGLGNDSLTFASDLGELAIGGKIVIGLDADTSNQRVAADTSDFVSISNGSDVDFFSFSTALRGNLAAELTPLGGTFSQSAENERPRLFDATTRSDLSLSIVDATGTTLVAVQEATLGEVERLDALTIEPGVYFARVEGDEEDAIQMYALNLQLSAGTGDCNGDGIVDANDLDCACAAGLAEVLTELGTLVGDLDLDGTVHFGDFLVVARNLGEPGGYADGDFDCDGEVAFADFLILANAFGDSSQSSASVPEPTEWTCFVCLLSLAMLRQRRRRDPHVRLSVAMLLS